MTAPDTQYAVLDGRYLAFQVCGSGERDIVMLSRASNPIDLIWDDPLMAGVCAAWLRSVG